MLDLRIGDLTTYDFPLIAVPLVDKSLTPELNVDDADVVEMRVDMFDDISEKYVVNTIIKAREQLNKPIITTIRRFSEGGAIEIDDKTRKNLFKAVIKQTDAVDIEIKIAIRQHTIDVENQHPD